MRILSIAAVVILLAGCFSQPYRHTQQGKFSGALDVRWVSNDYFLFIPNKSDPLTFTRKDGRAVHPGTMYTDGGSIPRFFWGVKGFSPWGYAPAYIVHDWLFEAQHCGYSPDNQFTFSESADILAEGLKSLMEANHATRSYFVFDAVYEAVQTPIAKKAWEHGTCKAPIVEFNALGEPPGEFVTTIRF